MKELKEIVQAFDRATEKGLKTALATVVKVEGSAYRREGARMLITEEGQLTGAISGGCLEGDTLRRAQYVMVQQRPMVITYDTRDDDHGFGLQLGCEGIIHLLIEPLAVELESPPIVLFKRVFEQRAAAVIVTFFNIHKKNQFGTCCIFNEKGMYEGSLNQFAVQKKAQITSFARSVLERRRSAFYEIEIDNQTQILFIEYLPTVPKLVIFGAGNDIRPLVRFIDILGWESTVIDGRPNMAKKARFQQASCVLVAKPDTALQKVHIDDNTFFLLMTHNYNYDLEVLKNLLNREEPVRYIGLLGPKKKFNRMLEELVELDYTTTEKALKHVYAPIGMDIGGSSPEGIALSILAEIQAVLADRTGGFLRNREGSINGY